MRLKKIPYAKDYLENSSYVWLLKENMPVLSSTQAQELEIGCGKGDFILAKAQANPDIQYYALERYDSVLLRAVEKQTVLGLSNIQFILGDAHDLEQFFPLDSLQKIYLNFSDPWPKQRHAKRRLTHPALLTIYRDLLQRKGTIELKTDNRLLFEYSMLMFAQNKWSLQEVSCNLYQTNHYENIRAYQTEYEKKFVAKQKTIYYMQQQPE